MDSRTRLPPKVSTRRISSGPSLSLKAAAFQDHILNQIPVPRSSVPKTDKFRSKHEKWEKERKKAEAKMNELKAITTGDKLLRKDSKFSEIDEDSEDKEYVLGAGPSRRASLAEKLGLVERQKGLLSKEDWDKLKRKAKERGDSEHPCPICQEDYTTQEQVILSCSHTFHRSCLDAVERHFQGKKSCPLCRQENYEKRVVFEGRREYKQKCAIKLQAYWRMYRLRKRYLEYRKRVPPKDPMLRKKYLLAKLSACTNSLEASYNGFLTTSQEIMDSTTFAFEQLRIDLLHVIDKPKNGEDGDVDEGNGDGVSWDAVYMKSIDRGLHECAICLGALDNPGKPICLLSCTHVFHSKCLTNVEKYAVSMYVHNCPVCRNQYKRIEL